MVARISQTKRRRSPLDVREYSEQCVIFQWASLSLARYPALEWLNGSLNGVRLTIGQAVKMKKAGMKKGYPDINLPVPIGGYHGLYIELKIPGGTTSDDQRHWLAGLQKMGHFTCICMGANAAIGILEKYLNGEIDGDER